MLDARYKRALPIQVLCTVSLPNKGPKPLLASAFYKWKWELFVIQERKFDVCFRIFI